ncbi:MAG: adenine deaminase, partial [Chloroflexota bacterium]|nr:adenine deaminase [Chloroflexota bacterium]
LAGMRYVLDRVKNLPLDLFLMVPSCVPATPLETAGARISAEDVHTVLQWDGVLGLGEMMNFPGLLYGDREVSLKLALGNRYLIDGHCPGLVGKDLNAYIGTGIYSDHECTDLAEAQGKIRRGMYVMIREGSSEKNLEALLPLVTNETYTRCLFVVDDRSCSDLLEDGDIDAVVRKAIKLGMDPIRAIQLATVNTARYFHLDRFGAVAPGYFANLIIMDDLVQFEPGMVLYNGMMVAKDGQSISIEEESTGDALRHTVNIGMFDQERLKMSITDDIFPVIEIIPGQIVTKEQRQRLHKKDGLVLADINNDILKLVVVERHKASGNIGLGLVKGFGLKRGAMASSVAHDSHNIVAVGTNDSDIIVAVNRIVELQGGLTIAAEGEILAELPLPIGGLLSDQPLETVVRQHDHLESVAASLGCELTSPFSTLSFVALPVIPELRLTDLGLVDVRSFKLLT